ncbi:MAG: PadR family transcriptional regulator, partial [Longimicrobiales bacterium]
VLLYSVTHPNRRDSLLGLLALNRSHTPRTSGDPLELLPLTHVVYHILVSLTSEARHGYGIIKDVADRTGGRVEVEAGTLYAAIKRMTGDGIIEEVSAPLGTDARRRYYQVTEFGRAVAYAESKRLEAMVELAKDQGLLPGARRAKA